MENRDSDTDRHSSNDGVDTEAQIQGEVYRDQGQFLNNIHKNFLDKVQPIESGLVDVLRAEGVMSSDEEHIIRAGTTRRDTARKMWTLLKRVPPRRFQNSCYPALREKYPHVLEGKHFQWDGKEKKECLRHIIMNRIMLNRFGDLFPTFNGCTDEEYSIITEYGDLDHRWALAFRLCAKPSNASNADFVQTLQQMIKKIDVTIPDNFGEILANGFPCTCKPKPLTTQAQQKTKAVQSPSGKRRGKTYKRNLQIKRTVSGQTAKTDTTEEVSTQTSWKRKCDLDQRIGSSVSVPTKNMKRHCTHMDTTASHAWSSCGYPSTGEEVSETWSTESVSSHDTNDTFILGQNEGPKDADFAKRQDKVTLLKEMREINTAVKKASNIRPLFRELDGIKLELSILNVTAKSETSGQRNDLSEIRLLRKKADDIFTTIQRDFEFASRMNEQMTKSELSFDLPFYHRKNRLERIQMLGNETKEAATFAKLSEDVVKDMPPVPAVSTVVEYGGKDSTLRRCAVWAGG